MSNYIYILSERAGVAGADNDLFTVGFFDPAGKFRPESDHATREAAAERVHWLNGGRTHNPEVKNENQKP